MATVQFEHVTKQFAADVLAVDDLTLDVGESEFLILVGPSGCGKTTALRMVAGLEEISTGEIKIDGRPVNDLPPTERDIAMVFQNYALYPHMSVRENIAFPLRQRKLGRKEIAERVDATARLLSIDGLLERKPRELSGGERQRVAIGRALVRRPRCFLMDEPLSNLDAKLRVQMRAELISLHQQVGITTIYVTHDQTEAMTLGDRVVVLNDGVVQQVDTPDRLYREPANVFVAGFIGSPAMNLLAGTTGDGSLQLGAYRIGLTEQHRARLGDRPRDVIVGLRPEDLLLADRDLAAGDGLSATVQIVEQLGPEVIAYLHADSLSTEQTVVARFQPTFAARLGDRIQLTVDVDRLRFFDPVGGGAI